MVNDHGHQVMLMVIMLMVIMINDHGHRHQHPHHNSRVLGRMIQVGRAEPQMPRHCVPHLLPPHQRHCQRHHHHHLHHPILIIIITRTKPAYGRQGLAGSWGQDTNEVSTFLVFLTSHFAHAALSLDYITWDH